MPRPRDLVSCLLVLDPNVEDLFVPSLQGVSIGLVHPLKSTEKIPLKVCINCLSCSQLSDVICYLFVVTVKKLTPTPTPTPQHTRTPFQSKTTTD